ncbi:MAG: hypothetical protein KJ941_03785 [Bacteroidetes bacterium]|nr:hypothetical protein [Bacteroidota bacterium]
MTPPKNVIIVETDIATNWLSSEGWFCSISKNVPLTVEKLQNHYLKVGEMTGGKPVCFLVWPNFSHSATLECRRFLQSIMPVYSTSIAMITDNPMMKIGINLFIKISPVSVPLRIFTDQAKAISWLQEFENNTI